MPYFSDLEFGLTVGHGGNVKLVEDIDSIRQSIFNILTTRQGERWMNPEFGCGIWKYLFEPISDATSTLINLDIKRALSRWEERIILTSVSVEPYEENNAYYVTIAFNVRNVSSDNDGTYSNASIYKTGQYSVNLKLTQEGQ